MAFLYKDTGERSRVLQDVQRVVIKVGTRLLTDIQQTSKAERVTQLIEAISVLRQRNVEVILVTSGAVGAGMSVLGTGKRPVSVPMLQGHAAVGQSRLMYLYETAAVQRDFHCAQLLLTSDDVKDRERHLNVTSCLDALLGKGVLPIINENDSVSVEEIKFGDNDMLAALVAAMLRADLTILLTTVDGMYEKHDDGSPGARLSVVTKLSKYLYDMSGGTDGNRFSVGGMITKLRAAELVSKSGESLWIADGHDFNVLHDIFAGQDVGTLFMPGKSNRMQAHKRFLAFFSEPSGELIIDAGAACAICEQGRSLLPSGIVHIAGQFRRGDTVRILNRDNQEIARGISNYNADEVARIKGRHTLELKDILGYDGYYDEVVHRSYLVLT